VLEVGEGRFVRRLGVPDPGVHLRDVPPVDLLGFADDVEPGSPDDREKVGPEGEVRSPALLKYLQDTSE
jgi:hypothetical protein